MSYEHKDPAGPGSQPPVYNAPAPVDATYNQQPQQQPIQPVQYQQESYEQKQPQVEQQQQQYQQPQQQQQQQQPQQTGSVMPLHALSSSPAPIMCPNCHQRSMTRITPVTGNTTHAWALALCCLVCLGCIPYCIGSFKDIEHQCGNCGIKVATWHRSGRTDAHMM